MRPEATPVASLPLHRHQLARLTSAGWQRVRDREWDADARACLAHWAARDLPLVIARQPAGPAAADAIAMGLPAPGRWGRRRYAFSIPRADVSYFDEFPRAQEVRRLLPERVRGAWDALCDGLRSCGAPARVYGSHGWRHITGLDHVHADSDIDLWTAVSDAEQADEVARRLQSFACARPRLDGELVFDDGGAVAWREWLAWRSGRARAVLVKRVEGCVLWQQPIAAHAVQPSQVAA
jgi:phosphoribosyl-dephospho-CoA transferase